MTDVLTAVDRIVIGVADLAQAVETYRNLGFTVTHGRGAEDAGLQAAYVVFGDFYIELQGMETTSMPATVTGTFTA